jgi:hypothetical protein
MDSLWLLGGWLTRHLFRDNFRHPNSAGRRYHLSLCVCVLMSVIGRDRREKLSRMSEILLFSYSM